MKQEMKQGVSVITMVVNDLKHVSYDRLRSIEYDARGIMMDTTTNYFAARSSLQAAEAERRRRGQ